MQKNLILKVDHNQIKILKPYEKKLLCFYAYIGDEVTDKHLVLFSSLQQKHNINPDESVKKLINLSFLTLYNYNWQTRKYTYQISIESYLTVLHFLIAQQPEWFAEFEDMKIKRNTFSTCISQYLQANIQGKKEQINGTFPFLQLVPRLLPVAFEPSFMQLISGMNEEMFCHTFLSLLVYMQKNDLLDSENMMPMLLEQKTLSPTNRELLKEALALYRYYSHGEYAPSKEKPQTLFGIILEGVRAMHAQKYKEATAFFDKALKIRNKEAKEKNIFDNFLNCYFLMMNYVHEGSSGSMKKLEQFLKKNDTKSNPEMLSALIVADAFCNEKVEAQPYLVEHIFTEDKYHLVASPATKHMGYLFCKYFGLKSIEIPDGQSKIIPQQAIYRHELSAYLPLSQEERKMLADAYGDAPALTSIPRKQPWEIVIENILKKEQEQHTDKGSKEGRVAYLIRGSNLVEIREQGILKSGAWSSGRTISEARYLAEGSKLMDETDHKVRNLLLKRKSYMFSIEDILPALVGSDRVFTGYYAPFTPVTVREEKPYLYITQTAEGFAVSSNIPLSKINGSIKEHIILKESDTLYTVIPITNKQWNYYKRLMNVGTFPPEAEQALKAFLPQISKTVEVHSPLLENGSTLESVNGSASICLQVAPESECFCMTFCVRPLSGGQKTFAPGKGTSVIFDEADGKRLQVKRQLTQEWKNYEALNNFMEDAFDRSFNGFSNNMLYIHEMLDMLEFVRQAPDTYFIEWPEGKKLNLHTFLSSSDCSINLKAKGNWFEVEGEIRIDEQTVLSATQLLEILGNAPAKYIRLNETDYLKLDDMLRKQLQKLEALSIKERGKMKISGFNAGLLGEALEGELKIECDKSVDTLRKKIRKSLKLAPEVPTTLQASLRNYQEDGFQWIVRLNSWGAGACLADDMGLGKTIQTIAFLLYKANEGASLVIAPASVIPNWRNELQRFAPTLKISILNESTDRRTLIDTEAGGSVILSTYGLLVTEEEALVSKKWNVVCLDEAHTIKNRDTKMSKVAMRLQADNKLILTGTPIQNHLSELWNLFAFITPGMLGSYEQFSRKYITPIEQEGNKEKQRQLKRIVSPFMLRRTKTEVLEELPEKMEIILPVELSEKEMSIYEALRLEAKKEIETTSSVNVSTLAAITRLRQAACAMYLTNPALGTSCSKIQMLVSLINEIKEGNNRVLIFSQFTSFLELVRRTLDEANEKYLYLDGSTNMKQREKMVKQFQQGECPLFLISLKAGGLGLNLTGANYVIHLDPWWNPAIEQQATDRAYRIGQQKKVTVYHLIAQHTIEEKILRLHHTKRNLADSLIEGNNISHKLTEKELLELLTEETDEDN
ncbi:DEAD/DEAH box helicase [uncultured Bacteroides sp.]|uniref:DEAD/DEAH box helicase n=1 Tax=uncultured Bacteroides sp. TaxID=162156 RepID=UPI00261B1BCA|nr:DEAD/DEAH box helicase [uncultured Bacteroides sp.]